MANQPDSTVTAARLPMPLPAKPGVFVAKEGETCGPDGAGAPGPICEVRALSKRYGAVQALSDVSLSFRAGQVHAILGENGAGKSTLTRILAGSEQADAGSVVVDGRERAFVSGTDANRAGIAMVFQELSLYPDLDVLANLFARREATRFGLLRRGAMRVQAQAILDALSIDVDLNAVVGTLPLHARQLLEIAKALIIDPRVLILDEPTSALTVAQTGRLLRLVSDLRASGTAIVFVSHRLKEVLEIADVISVLRDGQVVVSVPAGRTSIEELVTHMIGQPRSSLPTRPRVPARGSRALAVRDLTVDRVVHGVTFEVTRGEVVGLAGLDDSGIGSVFEAIFGAARSPRGTITLPNGQRAAGSTTAAVKAGVAYVPPDRREAGLMLEQTVAENLAHVTVGVLRLHGRFPSKRAMRERAQGTSKQLKIRAPSVDAAVQTLSGGNQQKVVLGRWMQATPGLILLDDPTRGVDVGAKVEIYRLIGELARTGCAVLFRSSELLEYEHTCHRVLVMRRGRLIGELVGDAVGEHAILRAMNLDEPVAR